MKKIVDKHSEAVRLLDLYTDITEQLGALEDKNLKILSQSSKKARETFEKISTGEISGIGPKKAISSIKQALIEIPMITSDLPPDIKKEALKIFFRLIKDREPTLFSEAESLVNTVKERGEIKNPKEFYAVRATIDSLESDNNDSEAPELYRIINNYDTKA